MPTSDTDPLLVRCPSCSYGVTENSMHAVYANVLCPGCGRHTIGEFVPDTHPDLIVFQESRP